MRFAGIDAVSAWQDQGGTAPLESKTNFISAADGDCETVALVTQTRMVL
jgi:hypothetical protein